jgi:hypothetical protein
MLSREENSIGAPSASPSAPPRTQPLTRLPDIIRASGEQSVTAFLSSIIHYDYVHTATTRLAPHPRVAFSRTFYRSAALILDRIVPYEALMMSYARPRPQAGWIT